MPQDGETEISETAPATLVALDQRLKITDSPDTEQVKEEGEVVTEAYIKLSTVQWEWGDVLPAWQRNAVRPLVHSDTLCRPDHPLRLPSDTGICLYNVTDFDGYTRLSMSLHQLEYLQHYIHEMRLADPVWVKHITSLGDLDKAHESDKDVGLPEYPEGEEWLRLPDAFIHGKQIVNVEKVYFDEPQAIKRLIYKQKRQNKSIEAGRYVAREPKYEAEAEADNNTPDFGLRGDSEREDGAEQAGTATDHHAESESDDLSHNDDIGGLSRTVSTVSSDSSLPTTASAENFTSAYYHHAQQALLMATLGGMFEAHKEQAQYVEEEDLKNAPPIGRGLFMSIRVTTWDADDETVLEVGWSALWFQERLDSDEAKSEKDKYEELREVGHIIVQDHLSDKKNGVWKPEHKFDFRFGDSLPIAEKDTRGTLEDKIKELSQRAGGGPIFIILHSADGVDSDPSRTGMDTKDWLLQFKSPSWSHPCYNCVDGIGKTFVIDTAILFAAVEYDSDGPAPIKTSLSMEKIAAMMFTGEDDPRRPLAAGNAGNDAFYNLELCIALLTASSLDDLRSDFKKLQEAQQQPASPISASTIDDKAVEHPNDALKTPRTPPKSDESDENVDDDDTESVWSDEDRIGGVYAEDSDGELIQIG